MTGRRVALIAAATLVASTVAVIALPKGNGPGSPLAASSSQPTAPVIRTTLASRQQVSGTLERAGAYTVVFQQPAGTVSWLAPLGSVIGRGGVLYAVDGQPVRLLYGSQAAYRTLAAGIAAGPDVRQLQRNLIALGYSAGGRLSVSGLFDWATAAAVEQWQRAQGVLATGVLTLGSIAFLPGPVHVDSQLLAPGTPPPAGTPVLALSSLALAVSVPLDPALRQLVHVGDPVQIQLPEGQSTPGRVTQIGTETAASTSASVAGTGAAGSGSSSAASASGSPATAVPVTVALDHADRARGLAQVPVEVSETTAVQPVVYLSVTPGIKPGPDGKLHDAFSVTDFQVHANQAVKLVINNTDDVPHSITSPDAGVNIIARPGTHTYTLLVHRTGRFSWYCSQPCDPYSMSHVGYMRGYITAS